MSDPFIEIIREQDSLERRIGQTEVREVRATLAVRYKTGTGQSIANNPIPPTIIDFGTADFDTHSRVTTGAAWKFTANVAGYYGVAASILYAATTAWADTEAGYLALYKNGSLYSFLHRRDSYGSASSVFMMLSGTDTISLAVGDYIDVRVFQNTGGALALLNDATFNYVNIWKL
jgi:hypothetical protein